MVGVSADVREATGHSGCRKLLSAMVPQRAVPCFRSDDRHLSQNDIPDIKKYNSGGIRIGMSVDRRYSLCA
jgi:hypothetical protein